MIQWDIIWNSKVFIQENSGHVVYVVLDYMGVNEWQPTQP